MVRGRRRVGRTAHEVEGPNSVVEARSVDAETASAAATAAQPSEAVTELLGLVARATEPIDASQAIVDAACAAADAQQGGLLLSEGGASFGWVARTWSGPDDPLVLDQLTSPLWRTALARAGLRWDHPDRAPHPALRALPWHWGLVVGVPVAGRRAGLLVVGDPAGEQRDGDPEDVEAALHQVAEVAALALDRREHARERQGLERLLRATVSTSASLVGSVDPDSLRERFLAALVDELGFAGAALWLPTDQGMALASSRGLPGEVIDAVRALPEESMAAKLDAGVLPPALARAGAATAASSWPGRRVRLVNVPDPTGGVVGVYHERALGSLVDGVLATLVQSFAAALHQTTLHAQARRVVDALQQELRPRDVPERAGGLDLGWVYRSATAGVDVGGDFFDVLRTEDGHVGIGCGDVSGKGVEAASLTAMAVHSLRAYALHGSAPSTVMTMLNGAIADQTSPERFVTIAYLLLDPVSGRGGITSAGHPPPVRVGHQGIEPLDLAVDLPAGVDPTAPYAESPVRLAPGESLVLYTDGVTEARRADDEALLGLDGLVALLRHAPHHDAQAMADAVWTGVQEWTGGGTTDDTAVVVVRRPHEPA